MWVLCLSLIKYEGITLLLGITNVSIEDLFGRYNYSLDTDGEEKEASSRISLLYGDNGTGKTTILELIFHLLSSSDSRGHRTHIAGVPFRKLTISLSDGTQITASRSRNSLVGDFQLQLIPQSGRPETGWVRVDPDTGTVPSGPLSVSVDTILEKISELSMDVFYLSDSRDLAGDTIPHPRRFRRPERRELVRQYEPIWSTLAAAEREGTESNLTGSIERMERTLRTEAIRASSTGETDAWQSYSNFLRTIATNTEPTEEDLALEISKIKEELLDIQEITTRHYEEFRFGSVANVTPLLEVLTVSDTDLLPSIVSSLRSFIDGQWARVRAADLFYQQISSFITILNRYLNDKTVHYNIFDGLTLHVSDQILRPDQLSSGEKHLLLLFLNVFTASDQSALFLIDEPELSLNIKWQRNLVDSLLILSKDSGCQFILATHSIELLTKHRSRVVRLIT